ncbi:MAG TPA: glycosyltransferase family 39 protein [Spirochaetia bacterium]|nr:glycosyltransferase family 39 protein [Spirochaetia bacterium]
MKKTTIWSLAIIGFILSIFFLSYRLTQTPNGLTIDEASIGYNAVLLSKNLHDESGRFLPFFPLTINGHDWKQPITAYSTAIVFKIFGPSLENLRLVSVIVGLVSLFLVVYLGYQLLGVGGSFLSGLLFITTPMVLMHSHLAQENIMPVPFTMLWLISLFLFSKKNNSWFLFISGISLGLGLYSYKGMRAIIPVWTIITVIYIFLTNIKKLNKDEILVSFKYCLYFILGIFPFLAIIPWLNTHYAGAVFESSALQPKSFYTFIYPYLSSFDLSALFIKGDSTPWHSTGIYGVFLLSTLPLFLAGLVKATQKNKFWVFLLITFLVTPLLFGQVGSVYRFSRLLVFVPFFVLFSSLGLITIYQSKIGKFILPILSLLFIINFVDFTRYYWFQYPSVEQANFLTNTEDSYKKLAKIAKEKNLKPFVYVDNFNAEGEVGKFYEAAFFPNDLGRWKPGDKLPEGSVVMTLLQSQPNLNQIAEPVDNYYFLSNI